MPTRESTKNRPVPLAPALRRNDKAARIFIITVSLIVFAAIVALSRYKLKVNLGFSVHVFALVNAVINSIVSITLITAYIAVRRKNYLLHKKLMIAAIILSTLFLISYIAHHLLAGDTIFGGKGPIRYFYYFILATHILLAAVILPFILFTAYRGLTSDFQHHRKIARYTFPIWLYVSVTGVLVYLLISPYYSG